MKQKIYHKETFRDFYIQCYLKYPMYYDDINNEIALKMYCNMNWYNKFQETLKQKWLYYLANQ